MCRCLILCIVLAAGAARGETHVIRADGSGDYPTIQAAVDASADGDEILLEDGTYTGAGNRAVDLSGKAVTIRSASGVASAVVVDCESGYQWWEPLYAGFLIRAGEGAGTVLANLTIVRSFPAVTCDNGSSPSLEGVEVRDGLVPAIRSRSSSPVLRGCVVEANSHAVTGSAALGSVSVYRGSAVLEDCRIRSNALRGLAVEQASIVVRDCVLSDNAGGGVSLSGSPSASIERCTITDNRVSAGLGGGISASVSPSASALTVSDCTISGNYASNTYHGHGGGISVTGTGTMTFERCTITGNRAGYTGGGVRVSAVGTARFVDCTIAANAARVGGGVYAFASAADPAFERSIVWGNCASESGPELCVSQATVSVSCGILTQDGVALTLGGTVLQTDVIDADPLFCMPVDCASAPDAGGIWQVSQSSPAYTHPCGPIGAHGAGCAISIEPLSWGSIKARYR